MIRLLGGVLALGLAVLAVTAADAQGEEGLGYGVSLGAYVPVDGDASDRFGTAWISVGITYDVSAAETAVQRIGVGWIQAPGKDIALAGVPVKADFRLVPLTYTYLRAPRGFARGLYYGGGGGIYFGTQEYEAAAGTQKETEAWLGLHLVGGFAFSQRLGAEARYTHVFDNVKGANVGGLTVAATGRF